MLWSLKYMWKIHENNEKLRELKYSKLKYSKVLKLLGR